MRKCRYIGLAKAHLQHIVTAAINLVRIAGWHTANPTAKTRCSRLAALQPAVWSEIEFATSVNVGSGPAWAVSVRRP
jgi:hypothetical protein